MNPIAPPVSFATPYCLAARHVALGVKRGDPMLVRQAALDMAPLIPQGSVLVPTPSRTGRAIGTLALALALAELTDCTVADVVTGRPRESVRRLKKQGRSIDDGFFGFVAACRPVGRLLVVDEVFGTGTTTNALASLLHADGILVHSKVAS